MAQSGCLQMPNKFIHVLGRMDRGGAETWLMNCLRISKSDSINYEILCLKEGEGAYDGELKSLGAGISCCSLSNIFTWPLRMLSTFKKKRPKVVYSHCHYFSGIILFLAYLANIKTRVAHSHLDTRLEDQNANLVRRFYLGIMRALINKFATHRVYVSSFAGEALFGSNFEQNGYLLFPGIPIKANCDGLQTSLKKELGLENAFVIGHVGRFSKQKNHEFLLNIFQALSQKREDVRLLLLGGGELEGDIRRMVKNLGLAEKVLFAGIRNDVHRMLTEVIDVVCFPSLYEGLPVSLLEAQVQGVPCIISDTIAPEVCINPNVKRVAIVTDRIPEWCDLLLSSRRIKPDLNNFEMADVNRSVSFFRELFY